MSSMRVLLGDGSEWVRPEDYRKLEQQLAEARAALSGIAEHAHAGGLDGETQSEAMCEIRRLCLPWWDVKRTNDRLAAALKAARE